MESLLIIPDPSWPAPWHLWSLHVGENIQQQALAAASVLWLPGLLGQHSKARLLGGLVPFTHSAESACLWPEY